MKLNVDILMDELSNVFNVRQHGPDAGSLHLLRPELLPLQSDHFQPEKNRIYILAVSDTRVIDPLIYPEAFFLIVGTCDQASKSSRSNLAYIEVQEEESRLVEIFNFIQRIFDKYDRWEFQLQHVLASTASVQEMIDVCENILSNPLIVIDSSLHFIGSSKQIYTDPALTMYRPGTDGKVHLDNLQQYLKFRDHFTKAGPSFYDHDKVFIWDVWHHDQFLGNVTMPYINTRIQKKDKWLMEILETYLADALVRYINNPDLRTNILHYALQNLLDEKPLTPEMVKAFSDFSGSYRCLRMKFQIHTNYSQPIAYYCSYVESMLPSSICLAYASSIVVFVNIKKYQDENFDSLLQKISTEMHLTMGVSNTFSNLSHAHRYYQQAYYAQKQLSSDPEDRIARFEDVMLRYLLEHALGGLPVESFYQDGVRRLLQHDTVSKVSYAETLLVYLRNSMNITATAIDLHIHRSSFLERMRNINSLLQMDLDDDRQRLYLQIILENIRNTR